ncbi:MAG: bifunctional adenosylcobinamide kinase/adenosylcobinamide-phosphate guanylyltransferase [Chloroflexota bacterium]|nr:bifunctional adenosylcobinamide kinase/adenosylcobinamide-phosphate guanylyltransferase [Chloroflexota bacterium]
MSRRLTLVLGGVRAGKSRYAQELAGDGGRVLFVATAEPGDEEMAARIAAHRAERPATWSTLEEPIDLVTALTPLVPDFDTVLIDCLTLWVSNLLLQDPDREGTPAHIQTQARRLIDLYERSDVSWIVVSNEVGLGVIPTTRLGRDFADGLGRVNQQFAAAADDVVVMFAGLPVNLKTPGPQGR